MKKYAPLFVIAALSVLTVFILKNLFAILGVAVVLGLIYFFIIKPLLDSDDDKNDNEKPGA